jgi:hypothetical protein
MFDRIFAPVLAFLMLLAATATVAAGFFPGTRSAMAGPSGTPPSASTDAAAPLALEPVLISPP